MKYYTGFAQGTRFHLYEEKVSYKAICGRKSAKSSQWCTLEKINNSHTLHIPIDNTVKPNHDTSDFCINCLNKMK